MSSLSILYRLFRGSSRRPEKDRMLLFCTIMADLQVCAAVYIVNVCGSKVWFHPSRILTLIKLREPHDYCITGSRHLPSYTVHTHLTSTSAEAIFNTSHQGRINHLLPLAIESLKGIRVESSQWQSFYCVRSAAARHLFFFLAWCRVG